MKETHENEDLIIRLKHLIASYRALDASALRFSGYESYPKEERTRYVKILIDLLDAISEECEQYEENKTILQIKREELERRLQSNEVSDRASEIGVECEIDAHEFAKSVMKSNCVTD